MEDAIVISGAIMIGIVLLSLSVSLMFFIEGKISHSKLNKIWSFISKAFVICTVIWVVIGSLSLRLTT